MSTNTVEQRAGARSNKVCLLKVEKWTTTKWGKIRVVTEQIAPGSWDGLFVSHSIGEECRILAGAGVPLARYY